MIPLLLILACAAVIVVVYVRHPNCTAHGDHNVDRGGADGACNRFQRMVAKHDQIKALRDGGPMTVADLMTEHLVLVDEDTRAKEVDRLMGHSQTRHVLVEKGELLVGIISDRDLVNRRGQLASQIMTRDPVSVLPSHSAEHALNLLIGKRISCLPVVEQSGRLCGVLTTTDLLLALEVLLEIRNEPSPPTVDLPDRSERCRHCLDGSVSACEEAAC